MDEGRAQADSHNAMVVLDRPSLHELCPIPRWIGVTYGGLTPDLRERVRAKLAQHAFAVAKAPTGSSTRDLACFELEALDALQRNDADFAASPVMMAIREAVHFHLNPPSVLRCGSRSLDLSDGPCVMGILNVTPDSFSDGGRYPSSKSAIDRGFELLEEGATVLDIGGESTRPGATPVDADEEWERVAPILKELRASTDVCLSIDTMKAEVARRAIDSGVDIVNDVSGMSWDSTMAEVVGQTDAALIIGHMRGRPRSMQDAPHYDDTLAEIGLELREKRSVALRAGVQTDRIAIDPGVGFGKRDEDNFRLLSRLTELKSLGSPLVVGFSRKSFIGRLLDRSPEGREFATAATSVLASLGGADVIRVHHVRATMDCLKIVRATKHHGGLV